MTKCGYLHYYDFRNRILSLPFNQSKIDEWINFIDAVYTTGWRTEDQKQNLYCMVQEAIITYGEAANAHNIVTQIFGTISGSINTISNIGNRITDIIKNPISWITIALIGGAIMVVKLR